MEILDLWGNVLENSKNAEAVIIFLKEQAELLSEKTNNKVFAKFEKINYTYRGSKTSNMTAMLSAVSSTLKYHFEEIKIPGNLDILATMNTSDQNVYTLDTAFTRRWSKERIPNEFNGHAIKDMLVPGMNTCTWGKFVEVVNNHIKDNLESLQVNEDKQVGAFFVKERDLLAKEEGPTEAKVKAFAYKVLEYLWDDVSKLDHSVVFNPSYKTFEGLVDGFVKHGAAIFNDKLGFKKEVQVVAETN